nr:unnamed protein product [Callosobruchus analis]
MKSIDDNTPCEVQLLNRRNIQENCHPISIHIQSVKVEEKSRKTSASKQARCSPSKGGGFTAPDTADQTEDKKQTQSSILLFIHKDTTKAVIHNYHGKLCTQINGYSSELKFEYFLKSKFRGAKS